MYLNKDVLVSDVVLEAAALPLDSLETSFYLSWSRLCLRSLLLLVLPRYWTKCLSSALFLGRPRLGLEASALDLLEVHELVTFQGFVVHLVHLANKFSVLILLQAVDIITQFTGFTSLLLCFSITFLTPQSSSALPRPQGFRLGLSSSASTPASGLKKWRLLHHWMWCFFN